MLYVQSVLHHTLTVMANQDAKIRCHFKNVNIHILDNENEAGFFHRGC